ncbi:hypothetical protein [Pseudomonas aeruginosa]|uniref:hypothetical protein n=1 Tax=Pseudomonas aeruginosa TaxID=287 RepID=UPI000EB52917|nr:hypothetical protein [Pseudomonas aeruginosa]MBG5799776.1 hypothetical protein [Pseudomonas aeruginosa]MBP8321300.1 hypothetical protein [Pseudomonas aeruginosa]MBP8351281.1 hypothetical protein [Pseudomonas aeruginosa]RTU93147.1 hypothetical protein DY983_24780 [Pseudomonas aeruginosa]
MEQAMREEFEAWVSGRKVCTRYGAKLTTNPDGMYCDYRINDRWLAWKASRAALRVELPEPYAFHQEVQTVFRDRVKEALQQAGIEVK